MTQEKPGLGEQALNKIAEMALASQFGEAERLQVQVKVDPSNLAKGEVDSLAIEGEGLVMQQHLRVEELEMHIDSITVNPLNALFGKIELTKATEGTARIVLTEADITSALNSEAISATLRQMNIRIEIEGTTVTINTRQIECRLLSDGKITLNIKIWRRQTGENRQVSFTTTPQVSAGGQGIVFQDVQYAEGKERSPELTAEVLSRLGEILNLRNFEIEGMSLSIYRLDVEAGKLTLFAEALVTQFPKS